MKESHSDASDEIDEASERAAKELAARKAVTKEQNAREKALRDLEIERLRPTDAKMPFAP